MIQFLTGFVILIAVAVVAPNAGAMVADFCPNDPSTQSGVVSLDITSAWVVRNVWYGQPRSEIWTAVRNTGTAYACMIAVWASRPTDQTTSMYVGFSSGLPAGAEWVTESDSLPTSMVDGPSCVELRVMLMPHPIHALHSGPPRTLCRSSVGDLKWNVSVQPAAEGMGGLRLHVQVTNTGTLRTPPFRMQITNGHVRGVQYVSVPRLQPRQLHEQEVRVALREPASTSDDCLRLENAEPVNENDSEVRVESLDEFGELRLNLPVTACVAGRMGSAEKKRMDRTS